MEDAQTAIDLNIRTSPLGVTFDLEQLGFQCKAVYGGVVWPGKKPGFAVVVAMERYPRRGSNAVYLLDEYESEDMRKLVRQCGVLNHKHAPTTWVGDRKNEAAHRFIREMNDELELPEDLDKQRRTLSLSSTWMLDMQYPYEYIVPTLKDLLAEDRRLLFLKDSNVRKYLGFIKPDEIPYMEFGELPAVEALAFAVVTTREESDSRRMTPADCKRLAAKHRRPW